MMKLFPERFRRGNASALRVRLTLLTLLTLFGNLSVMAQGQTLTGLVKEVDGTPLPGVTVQIKGTNRGTQTNADGVYQLTNVEPNATLVFSFIGKTPQEAVANGRSTIDVVLADDSKSLTEVVVVGYGTQRRKDLTGSIAAISSEEFQKGNVVTPEQLIAGKLSGVQITPPSGQPGGGSTIRIRGGSSLNASNDPLVVIDGLPVDNSGISGASNPLSLINPQDIETFTVLKDASAAAIYGARAANGVILITTKRGQQGDQLRINASVLGSVSVNSKLVPVLSADQFTTFVNTYGTAAQKALLGPANTNWQKEIYHPAFSVDANVSASGTYRKMPYRVSLGYLDQNGVLKTSNFQRVSAAVSATPRFFQDHLKVDINLKGSIINNTFADQGAIGSAIAFDPTQPVYSGQERAFGGYFEWLDGNNPNTSAPRNPVGLLNQRSDKTTVNRSIGNVAFDYKFHFLPELRANLNLGYDISSSSGLNFVPASAASLFNQGGQNNESSQSRTNKTLEFYLNYAKDLKAIRSRVDVTGGYSYQDFIRDNPSYPTRRADNTEFAPAGTPFKTQYTLLAFFGRANYTFNEKYTLTATLRRDATSRFSPENRWGWFPSAGLAWSLKDEPFLKGVTALSALKLRVGYGVTGQQDFGAVLSDYPYLPRYTLSDPTAQYQFGNAYYRTLRAEGYDANIKWEETQAINAAVDYAFFDGRISGSIDVYQKKTKDLLSVIPVAAGSNLTNQLLTNVGNLENKGIEFTLNTNPIRREGLNLDVNFNITYNENKITNLTKVPTPNDPGILTGDNISGGTGNKVQIHTVGFPTNAFYVYRQVYDESGKPIEGVYQDLNGDGKFTIEDRYRYKSPNPKLFLGFTSQLTYGRFSAGFVLRGNVGNYVYNNVRSSTGTRTGLLNVQGAPYLRNGSTEVLTSGFVGGSDQYLSDYYLENASFLRMDNVNVGYDFGRVFGKSSSLRATANVQNAFVITKYQGLDPEISGGIDNNFYPRPRIFSLGLNANF
ncbi:SusC/RagA family TonB-linked outer membrane protein [Spirosoma soli]|uniref:SusC/RagA family TonB-linked outer membrane protein n=1 Tax=Spirosoma soli TaxID=1770529 RepID=A0ABW5MBQ4_9BACT